MSGRRRPSWDRYQRLLGEASLRPRQYTGD